MFKRDAKLIAVMLIFVILGFFLTLLAAQLDFLPDEADNPALLTE